MKKLAKIILSISIAITIIFGVSACAESVYKNPSVKATAIGEGYSGCIIESTVLLDGFGQVTKVIMDEIFPYTDVIKNSALFADTDKLKIDKVTIGTTAYPKYLHIGDKYFQADPATATLYVEIGVENGIASLGDYVKTAEGISWYYNSYMDGKQYIATTNVTAGTAVGDVKLKDEKVFNTSNGSMRKRYSSYWSNGYQLGFNGNMENLENYLITYGFDHLDTLTLPKDNGTKFNEINGISTGATLSSNTGKYLGVAKLAYDKAVKIQATT